MSDQFNYRAKATELHALRIALEEQRYGRSMIRLGDYIALLGTAAAASAAISAHFTEAFREMMHEPKPTWRGRQAIANRPHHV